MESLLGLVGRSEQTRLVPERRTLWWAFWAGCFVLMFGGCVVWTRECVLDPAYFGVGAGPGE
ncbi:hypothetical protein RRSWK_03475 [Rhodopirellula sp. SWK7]|nr:hypothetical protein RRSWK_03475 [Rhodopirellula sp. SWK7]